MSKIRTLSILVGILAVINIGLLIFLLIGPPKHKGHDRFGGKEKAEKFVQKKFGFDENQMKAFVKSKESHARKSKKLQNQLNELSKSFYLTEEENIGETRYKILQEINGVSSKIYENNAKHIDDVRYICTPEQMPELNNFIRGLIQPKKIRGGKNR